MLKPMLIIVTILLVMLPRQLVITSPAPAAEEPHDHAGINSTALLLTGAGLIALRMRKKSH